MAYLISTFSSYPMNINHLSYDQHISEAAGMMAKKSGIYYTMGHNTSFICDVS